MYRKFFKRLVDFILSLTGAILLLPIMPIFITILYFANERAGIFFLQKRAGKGAKTFKVIKFKTMNDRKDENGNLLPSKERITKVGSIFRSYSIDEIPQLYNVLLGDMSLVGPRPLLVQYLPLYDEKQARRHEVKPGITGLAQVKGRNTISWSEKFEYDIHYVDNISLMLDLKILLLTIKKVIIKDGVDAGASVTMPTFNGKN